MPNKQVKRDRLLILTGMSGAGKSTALDVLEDLGFETVDNIPLRFVEALATSDDPQGDSSRPLAVGLDIRTRDFDPGRLAETINSIADHSGHRPQLLFLDCEDDDLLRRFAVTRRPHPLARDRDVTTGLAEERALLATVRDFADMSIDTTGLSIHELRRMLETRLVPEQDDQLILSLTSFSYRHGLPRQADLVFDVRFLRNPHYVEELRTLTGREGSVAAYIAEDENYEIFFTQLTNMLMTLLPRYNHEGKHYLTIGIGCTGGQHRSVFITEQLARFLIAQGYDPLVTHRELTD